MKIRRLRHWAMAFLLLAFIPGLGHAVPNLNSPTAPLPPPNADIVFPANFCNGTSVTVCVYGNPSGTNYEWTIDPGNGSILNFSGTNMSCVTFTADGTQATVEVIVTDNFGNQSANEEIMEIEDCCLGNDYVWNWDTTSNIFGPGPVTLTGNTITINGQLIVDTDLTLEQCTVDLRPNASIWVNPGQTFTINGTTLRACSNKMWFGVMTMDPTSMFISSQSSVIQEAQFGVYSMYGGNFKIEETTFDRNYMGLNVFYYSGIHPGTVKASKFICTAPLIEPYAGGMSEVGVNLISVDQIQIGDPSSPDNTNYFQRQNMGIFSQKAGFEAYNNVFSDIHQYPNSVMTTPGVAIYAYNLYEFATTSVTIGGPGLKTNRIENSTRGISTSGNLDVVIAQNTLRNIADKAIISNYIPDRNLEIYQNEIHDFGHGIYLDNIDHANVKIKGNLIANNNPVSTTQQGIYVFAGSNAGDSLLVQDNTIRNVMQGIFVSKMPNSRILNNQVQYNLTEPQVTGFSGVRTGIELWTSFNSLIEGNEVTNTSASNIPIQASEGKLIGIKVANSEHTTTWENHARYMGRGYEFFTSFGGSTRIQCNQADACWSGMHFVFGDIGNQGWPNYPSGNTWVNHIGPYRITGQIVGGCDWYTSTDPDEVPFPATTGGLNQIVTSGTPQCLGTNKTDFAETLEPVGALVLHLYPNPNHGQFNLAVEGMTTPGTLRIFNALGQQVHQQTLENGDARSLSPAGLPAGLYWLQVETAGQTLTHKLTIH